MTVLKRIWHKIRFRKITAKTIGTAGDNVPAEIEYYGRSGKVIGFWAYGYFDPKYPYQGGYDDNINSSTMGIG